MGSAAYGYGFGLAFMRSFAGAGVNLGNATITIAGQSVSVNALAAGNAALRVAGKAVSPIVIPANAALALAGKAVSPIVVAGNAALTLTGQAVTVPVEAAIINTANDNTTTAATTLTFAGKAIGDAATDRVVAVGVVSRSSTPTGCTIGGVTATLAAAETGTGGGVTYYAAIYYATVPTGTTADIVVTFNATTSAVAVSAWRISGGRVLDATAGGSVVNGSGQMTTSCNIHAGGVALWVGGQSTIATATFSSATQDYTAAPGGGRLFFSGHKTTNTDILPHVETMAENVSGGYAHVLVTASFKPA